MLEWKSEVNKKKKHLLCPYETTYNMAHIKITVKI